MRNRVKTIRAHAAIFAEGYGSNTDTFPSNKNFPGLLMLRVSDGVEVSATGKPTFLVPWGNIRSVDLYEGTWTEEVNNKSQAV